MVGELAPPLDRFGQRGRQLDQLFEQAPGHAARRKAQQLPGARIELAQAALGVEQY